MVLVLYRVLHYEVTTIILQNIDHIQYVPIKSFCFRETLGIFVIVHTEITVVLRGN